MRAHTPHTRVCEREVERRGAERRREGGDVNFE